MPQGAPRRLQHVVPSAVGNAAFFFGFQEALRHAFSYLRDIGQVWMVRHEVVQQPLQDGATQVAISGRRFSLARDALPRFNEVMDFDARNLVARTRPVKVLEDLDLGFLPPHIQQQAVKRLLGMASGPLEPEVAGVRNRSGPAAFDGNPEI